MRTSIMEVVRMTDQKKDNFRMYLMGIVHLVCCGLLLIFVLGGISIGAAISYLQKNLTPLSIVLFVTAIGWVGHHLIKRSER